MRLKRFLITIGLSGILGIFVIGGALYAGYARDAQVVAQTDIKDVVEETLERRLARLAEEADETLGDASEINVLLLGLDSRKEDMHPHCDGIHMFTLNVEDWTMRVTSVPRGTYAYIPTEKMDWEAFDPANFPEPIPEEVPLPEPGQELMAQTEIAEGVEVPVVVPEVVEEKPPWNPRAAFISNQSYISNSCALVGLGYGIEQIEKVAGRRADYVITVGFSQTMGILRQLGLPATESLQFLRHRQGYAIGDPQRSHNQAVFLKDLIANHGQTFADSTSLPLERVLYSFVDTDMSFGTAHVLLHGFLDAQIYETPDRIELSMQPHYATIDYHFDPEKPMEHLETFLQNTAPHLSPNDFSGATSEQIQDQLILYLKERIASDESVADLMAKHIWLQVEDDDAREQIHFDILSKHIETLESTETAKELWTDYILEKETLGIRDWAEKGKDRLRELYDNPPGAEPTATEEI